MPTITKPIRRRKVSAGEGRKGKGVKKPRPMKATSKPRTPSWKTRSMKKPEQGVRCSARLKARAAVT